MDSIGKIGLDLGVNYKGFNKQLNSIAGNAQRMVGGAFSKIGALIGGAFAVKSLISFGKGAINLASDLTEVQNVVDVTFGNMANDINNFSKTALTQFGLSELSAKKYTSTMGAMLKSSNITGTAVRDMSVEMTKLAADMASFYNLDTDEAFSKIRSGISGETEPLKQLGINLNVANVEAYALSQGITKSYSAMSQAEQTMVRYNYLLSVTKDAQGDFARNAHTWANQIKVLGEQWNIFKTSMGAGFINILTPVIKGLNTLMKYLQTAAAYFKAFTALIFGDATASDGASVVSNVADSFEDVSDGIDKSGKAAKKAKKELSRFLAPFDELNNITKDTAGNLDGATGGLGNLGSIGDMPIVDFGQASTGELEIDTSGIEKFFNKISSMAKDFYNNWGAKDIFDGIKTGMANIDFSLITENFKTFSLGLVNIFKSLIPNFQTISQSIGGAIGIGLKQGLTMVGNIFEPISQGFANFMTNNKDMIIQRFDEIMLTLNEGIVNIGLVWDEWGNIINNSLEDARLNFAAFTEDLLLNLTESGLLLQGIFTDTFNSISEGILKFIEDNNPELQAFTDGLVKMFTDMGELLNKVWSDSLNSLKKFWDEWGKPFVDGVMRIVNDIGGWFLYLYNDLIKPVWDAMMKWLNKLWNENLKEIVDELLDFVGKVGELIVWVWDVILKPLIDKILGVLVPAFSNAFTFIIDIVGSTINGIAELIKGIIKVINGLIDFVVGVFTGDWKRAWEGVSKVFSGIMDGLKAIFKAPINWIISGMNTFIRGLNKIKIPDWVPGVGGKGLNIKQIPHLARGGIIDQPTLAMVGERNKKEAVVPLENTAFANTFASAVANAVMAALSPLISGGGSNDRPIELVVNLGGSTVFRKLIEGINEELLMSGQLVIDL